MKQILIIEENPVIYLDVAACLWDRGWSPLPYCPSIELAVFLSQYEKPDIILFLYPHVFDSETGFHHVFPEAVSLAKPFSFPQMLDLLS